MLGKNLLMFASEPNNLNNTKNKETSAKYLDLCKIEIFLSVFCDNYIVSPSVYTSIIFLNVYRHISQLYQNWINNGKYTNGSPIKKFKIPMELQQYFQTKHKLIDQVDALSGSIAAIPLEF